MVLKSWVARMVARIRVEHERPCSLSYRYCVEGRERAVREARRSLKVERDL